MPTDRLQRDVQGASQRLPRGWASEAAADISCGQSRIEDRDVFVVRLKPLKGSRFFGFRPIGEKAIAAGETARLCVEMGLIGNVDIAGAFLVLREFSMQGQFLYQTQKLLKLDETIKEVSIYLTVREKDRVVQPAVLFQSGGENADVTVSVGTASLSSV